MKVELDNSKIVAWNLNNAFSIIDRTTRQKIYKGKEDFTNTVKPGLNKYLKNSPASDSRTHIFLKWTLNSPQDRWYFMP